MIFNSLHACNLRIKYFKCGHMVKIVGVLHVIIHHEDLK
jgi:hypothetical protein